MAAVANNARGIAGVCRGAPIKTQVISPVVPFGDAVAATAIVNAIRDARAGGAKIFHHGWHAVDAQGNPVSMLDMTLRVELRNSYKLNEVAVAPMGDAGLTQVDYPAGLRQGMLAVGATDHYDDRWEGSNRGSHIDVVAPGVNVISTRNGAYEPAYGTGIGAAHVTGLASLLRSQRPDLYNDDVEQIIRLTADEHAGGSFSEYGMGRINAATALRRLEAPYRIAHGSASGYLYQASYTGFEGPIYLRVSVNGEDPQGAPKSFAGLYWAVQRKLRVDVQFPVAFRTVPSVWGLGIGSRGLSHEGFPFPNNGINFNYGWCEPEPGITTSGCTLQTFVYDLWQCNDPNTCTGPVGFGRLGVVPTDAPDGVPFAYSVLGELRPTDAGGEGDSVTGLVAPMLLAANPWTGPGKLTAALPREAEVRLSIYDVAGRLVRTLHEGRLPAGPHEFAWDARDENGRSVASGLYFARLEAAQARPVTTKFAVLQ
jgi:hypothetical protein